MLAQLPVCKANVTCLAYSPGGSTLAAGSIDGQMYLLPASDSGTAYEKVSVLKVSFYGADTMIFEQQTEQKCCNETANKLCHYSPTLYLAI